MSEERFAAAAPLPSRIHRLHELAARPVVELDARARDRCSAGSTTRCGAQTAHNPVRMLQHDRPRSGCGRRRRIRRSSRSTTRRSPGSTKRARPRARGGRENGTDLNGKVDRLLLGGVRAAPVAADLCRRPRRARRRSLQGSERPRRAARRRRLHVPAGLLPPAHVERRLAGGTLRAAQLDRRADRDGDHAATASPCSPRCRSAIARCWPRSGGSASGACACSCSTPISRRTRRGIASSRRASTAAIARRASSRRSSSASAACACCARSGIDPAVWHLNEGHAAFVALQRIRELVEQRRARSTMRSRRCAARRCSRRTRRCRPVTMRSRSTWSRSTWPGCWGEIGQYRERFLALGEYDNGTRAAVQHDGAGAAHRRARQRRQRAARRGDAHDVAADLAGHAARTSVPVAVDHQRRARADLDRRRRCSICSIEHLGAGWLDRHDDPAFWERLMRHSRRGALGGAPAAARRAVRLHPRAAAPALGDERVSPQPHRRRRRDARSRCADHRLCAALHRLQAAGADLPRRRAAGAHPDRDRPAGADRVRRQGASRPTIRPSITCSRSSGARSTRRSAAASRSSTTTTCTSRTAWSPAATCG